MDRRRHARGGAAVNTWQELEHHSERVWDGLQRLHTCAFVLHDQTGRKITRQFTASDVNELREFFKAGARAYPNIQHVQVIAVLPVERTDQTSAYRQGSHGHQREHVARDQRRERAPWAGSDPRAWRG